MKNLIFLIFIPLLLSCNKKVKPCAFGTPMALFSQNTPGVSKYEFEEKGQNSFEKLYLDSIFEIEGSQKNQTLFIPLQLEIIQSGCEKLTREFRIEFFDNISPMPKNFEATECANIIAQIFGKLSSIDAKAIALAGFADEILSKQMDIEYGNPIKLRDGFSIQMDKMHSKESTLVTIILKNSGEQ